MQAPATKYRFAMCAFVVLGLLISTGRAFAGGGNVLPAAAQPKGYSLTEAAAATAHFNAGPRTPDLVPAGFPFQILYVPADNNLTFDVRPGTMLYVPLVFSDSNDAALWPFPDVTDPEAVSDYYFDPAQLGAEFIEIVVDGIVTSLGPAYAVGAITPGLPTGADRYTVAAAFLTPLSPGTHTVSIRVLFTGDFLDPFFPEGFASETTYTVNVH